jgi:serine-type D-Ala-D-Ala carboxypeptidase/endopeptidase (penicillin-binding protein 4)
MRRVTTMRAWGLALLFMATMAGRSQPPAMPLQHTAEQIVSSTGGQWGVLAYSVTSGRTLVSINADRVMVPASNNKVITAAWVLDLLGPDHRFPTDLLIDGPIENGVLRGNVIIRGSGDPAFGYPPRLGLYEFVEDPMTPLQKMAGRLAGLGVRVVEGSVIGDPTAFDDLLVGPNWPNDTGGGAAQYAPRVSGLAFQRNMLWVEAIPTPGGGPAEIRLHPQVTVVPVLSTVRTGGGRALAVRRAHEDTIRVSGAVAGPGNRFGVGVRDPAMMTTDALRSALHEAGIEVRGGVSTGAAPEEATLIHRHLSMPLGLMIPYLNRNSDNFFAEHLWKAAAHHALGMGSYVRGGPAAALHFMQEAQVPAGELYQFDGSGLSDLTRMSANALVRVLVYAHQKPYSELWHRSMAVGGDPAGSMSRLYRGTPAAGNLHGKTGYINGVRALSGYVQAANGELIAFSFLYNGGNTGGARGAQEQLGVLLAQYRGM